MEPALFSKVEHLVDKNDYKQMTGKLDIRTYVNYCVILTRMLLHIITAHWSLQY